MFNITCSMQWISEVMHFCAGLPIILVGCKKDLRREPRVIEELRKTSQRPVTPEEVCRSSILLQDVHDHTYPFIILFLSVLYAQPVN